MTLQITTVDDLLAEVAALVMDITPSREAHRGTPWAYMRGENLSAANLRAFDLIPSPKRVDPNGPHGDGIGYLLPLRIRISYGDLESSEAAILAGDDGDDLWQALEHAYLSIEGALPLNYVGEPYRWLVHSKDERRLVFDFFIELPFLGSDRFPSTQTP